MKLTDHLLKLETSKPYADATEHPFLRAAGTRSLSTDLLALWLSQDRIYAAHAYPRFIGFLISKIPFSAHHGIDSPEEKLNQRILKLLAFCVENIVREESFFRDTSEKFGLPIDVWREREETRNYTAEMLRVGSALSLEEGLVFLWAMEKVYLDAWCNVKSINNYLQPVHELPPNPAVQSFVDNWTSPEFHKFVDDLASLVNDLGIERGTDMWKRAEMVWDRVVELEVGFWPEEGEEREGRVGKKY